jgi:predicted metal-binding membrane protein
MAFATLHWLDGPLWAVRMGILGTAHTVSAAAGFGILVVAGIMSLAWMLMLTLVVLTERCPRMANAFRQVSALR